MWDEWKKNKTISCLSGLGSSYWAHQPKVGMGSSCSHEHCYSDPSLAFHTSTQGQEGRKPAIHNWFGINEIAIWCILCERVGKEYKIAIDKIYHG